MTLRQILAGVRLRAGLADQPADLAVESLEYDSRLVRKNTLFFAFQGRQADGRDFAREAMERGACAVASDLGKPEGFEGPWIEVEHGRQALALAARNLYAAPDERLLLAGITGTNGKTTVAHLLDSILRAAGKTTALVGTIQYRVAGEVRPAVNTTPESLDLYRIFSELEQRGGTHVTMEVSSHALALGRVHGIRFHTAVFTNLTRDHLDFHHGMEEYFAAKQLLFEDRGAPPPRLAAVNIDDPYGRQLRIASETERLTYGIDAEAGVRASNISVTPEGLRFDVHAPGVTVPVRSALIGRINVYNILAAYCAALSYSLDPDTIVLGIERCLAPWDEGGFQAPRPL